MICSVAIDNKQKTVSSTFLNKQKTVSSTFKDVLLGQHIKSDSVHQHREKERERGAECM